MKLNHLSTLREHHGCVNKISWSEDGSLLASCSDDLQVAIFRVLKGRTESTFSTTHTDNMTGVKFLPNSSGTRLVTSGADGIVELHELSDSLRDRIHVDRLSCHKSRVKCVEVEYQNPNLFFSGGEDGCVRQYDVRLSNAGCIAPFAAKQPVRGSMYASPNCLINAKVHVMSVRLSQADCNQMIVAYGDNLLRMYDRRMLAMTHPDSENYGRPVSLYFQKYSYNPLP
jgi:WD and tetratricopeptide repeats protein 1